MKFWRMNWGKTTFSIIWLAKFIYDSIQEKTQRHMLFMTLNWHYEITVKKIDKPKQWTIHTLYIDEAFKIKI